MRRDHRLLWFRRLSLAGAMLAFAVVVLGAWVRLTAAGLGCPDWPGCYGHVFPQMGQDGGAGFAKALHEMIHRYFATTLGAIITALLAFALFNRRDPAQPRAMPAALLVIVCLQGALGALTVTLLLTPLIVTAHLLGGLTTLGLLFWLSLTPARAGPSAAERQLRGFAVAGLCVLAMQVALGGWTSTNYAAIACPDFPTCQNSWWPPMDYADAFRLSHGPGVDYEGGILAHPARVAIHFTHRLGALVTGLALLTLALFSWQRAESRRLKLAAMLLALALCLQIALGIATVRFGVPLALATLHNAGAALLVLSLVNLLRTLWPSIPVVLPLRDVELAR
jgi:cytochrome c oxidase assembly protein subunit 15